MYRVLACVLLFVIVASSEAVAGDRHHRQVRVSFSVGVYRPAVVRHHYYTPPVRYYGRGYDYRPPVRYDYGNRPYDYSYFYGRQPSYDYYGGYGQEFYGGGYYGGSYGYGGYSNWGCR